MEKEIKIEELIQYEEQVKALELLEHSII